MAKLKRKRVARQSLESGVAKARWHDDLSPETKKSVLAVVFFAAALLTVLAYTGHAGLVGRSLYTVLDLSLGKGYFIATLALLLAAFSLLLSLKNRLYISTMVGALVFLVVSLGIVELALGSRRGGYVGWAVSAPLVSVFDFWASLVILVAFDVAALLVVFNIPLWARENTEGDEDEEEVEEEVTLGFAEGDDEEREALRPAKEKSVSVAPFLEPARTEARDEFVVERRRTSRFGYKRPPLDLLNDDRGTPSSGDIKANANIIQRTLENFGIHVEMAAVSVGPTVTQYALRPAEGVKISRILALQNDLALALAAHPIRVEAPIPGKSLVGIEVPNRSIALVGLRSLIADRQFQDASPPLYFALGRDVTGTPVYADLTRMPHLLIAGATGAGKSVGMHVIVTSFLYRNPPEVLRFIMVDPKRVELSMYNGVPHLLTPVITDPKKTIHALRWAVHEMERRYEMLSESGARDIVSFNTKVNTEKEELLPYIVIIVDELADLMMAYPREVEGSVVRLAQMARAVGIHLVLTTQRPSVEVITGLIKANITSRVAFQTGSQVDSRTILDMAGAEKLLGNGDMLFLAGDTAKPRRIQGAFVSESEVKKVVEFLRREEEAPQYETGITEPRAGGETAGLFADANEGDDELYEEAKQVVLESGKASASLLQRRLRVGYARAARLLDLLEENGIIGPGSGAKPREILAPTAAYRDAEANEKL
ncbi:MAG: DNA translocase FtsK [Candidatus Sungbacteria bacterium]|nr:DNA translocase FtsK [Candidatus Sungbacteria bacterium]